LTEGGESRRRCLDLGGEKPARQQERIMKHFKSPRQTQRFLAIRDQIANVFSLGNAGDTIVKRRLIML
jgi:transposase-like protein